MSTLFELIDAEQRAERSLSLAGQSEASLHSELLREAEQELMQSASLRREKVDRIFYIREKFIYGLQILEEEKKRLLLALKRAKNELKSVDELLYLGRNRIRKTQLDGNKYVFNFRKNPKTTVSIEDGSWELWSEKERNEFLIQEEVTILQRKVLRSMSGEIVDRTVTKKTKTQVYPNLDAIRNADKEGNPIPNGIKVIQEYSIKTARAIPSRSLESSLE
jgi:hypothetical protein